jgi:hypothetical protein
MLIKFLIIAVLINTASLFSQTKTVGVIFRERITSSKMDVSIFDNVIYIPISINNNSPVDFVLDTGAPDISIIESEITSKLELNTKRGGDLLNSTTGRSSLYYLILFSFRP